MVLGETASRILDFATHGRAPSGRCLLETGALPDVLLVGPYPPSIGGVSTHVVGLAKVLEDAGWRVAVLNHFDNEENDPRVVGALKRNPFRYWLALRRRAARVVHYHHSRPATLVAVALAKRRSSSRYLITVHGHSLERHLASPWGGLMRWGLRRFDELIAVSPAVAETFQRHVPQATITIAPAYLGEVVPHGSGQLPAEVSDFLARPGTTLVMSAFRIRLTDGGGDVYGLDFFVDLFLRLATRREDLRAAIFLGEGPGRRSGVEYLDRLLARAEAAGLSERLGLYVGHRLIPAFDHNVIYLRPTLTDGDAVSVRESLNANVPTLASDAAERPDGVHVLPCGDLDRWEETTAALLPTRRATGPREPARGVPDATQVILRLYGRHLGAPREFAP